MKVGVSFLIESLYAFFIVLGAKIPNICERITKNIAKVHACSLHEGRNTAFLYRKGEKKDGNVGGFCKKAYLCGINRKCKEQ